jgi:outer membrane protein assembly factor BamB
MYFSCRSKVTLVLIFLMVSSASFALLVSAKSLARATGSLNSRTSQTSSQTGWPTFGFDMQRTSYNPNETVLNPTNVSSLTLGWSKNIPGGTGFGSSPIIANGIVYIGDDTDTLYAYDATTGNFLWRDFIKFGVPLVTVVNGVAYVTTYASFNLVALDAKTGSLLWNTKMPGLTNSSPAVVNNIIYVSLLNSVNGGSLAAFNATDGSSLWNQPLPDGVNGSPAIVNRTVYVTGDNNVYALDAQTGNILWSGTISDYANGVAVSNGIAYINAFNPITLSSNLYAFKASGCASAPCSPLWVVPDGTYSRVPSSLPAIANGVVYVDNHIGSLPPLNGEPALYAFDAKTGATLWTWTDPTTGTIFSSSPAVANGVVYDATTDGNVYAFNASGCGNSTCSPLWTYNMGNGIGTQSSPIIVNGMVYIGASNSNVSTETRGILFAFHLPRQLIIFLQGITSSLDGNQANNGVIVGMGNVPDTIRRVFPAASTQPDANTRLLEYSYFDSRTDNGLPSAYNCVDTITNTLFLDILLLDKQIKNAFQVEPPGADVDIYLVGHSLGGVVALGYLEFLEQGGLFVSLPPGAHLKAVITLDSPIGGAAKGFFSDYSALGGRILEQKCPALEGQPLTAPKELETIFDSSSTTTPPEPEDSGTNPQGSQASILAEAANFVTTLPNPLPSNEDLAEGVHFHHLGISFLSIGNLNDFLFDPHACAGGLPSFLDTMFLEDDGDGSGLYGRYFVSGPGTCPGIYNIKQTTQIATTNHNAVLSDGNAQLGIQNFLTPLVGGNVGGTPSPLPVNPFQSPDS